MEKCWLHQVFTMGKIWAKPCWWWWENLRFLEDDFSGLWADCFFGKPCGFSHPKSFIFPCGIFDHFWDCWFCETLHQGKLRRIATWRGCHDPIKHDKFLDRFTKLEYWISKNKQQKKVGDRTHRDYDKNTSNEGSPYTLLNFYTVNIIVCQFCIFETKNFCGKK